MVRKELREHIFKMLFQIEFNEAGEMPEHLKYYFETLEDAAEKDKKYIKNKYEAVVSRGPESDRILTRSRSESRSMKRWSLQNGLAAMTARRL